MDCEFHNIDLTNLKKPCKFVPQPKGRGPAEKNAVFFSYAMFPMMVGNCTIDIDGSRFATCGHDNACNRLLE